MTQLRIEGVDVEFPFEPYPAQVEYMESVIRALETGANALLESPTGTGKTLCLLCASLAWLRRERTRLAPAASHLVGAAAAFSGTGSASAAAAASPRILYCSRTHAQLAQVARELKRTAYKEDITMALLGSREHMCVNSEVVRLPTTQAQQRLCTALRADHGCRYFRSLQRKQGPHLGEDKRVHDMEDLVKEGRLNGFCPYFHERDMAEKADIVLMPYNYILDPALRKQLPFPIENAVLIVDEAHNVPGVLSAAGCLNLLPVDLATAIHDSTRAVAALRLQDATVTTAPTPSATGVEEQELASLKLVLCQLEAAIAAEPMTADDTHGTSAEAHPRVPAAPPSGAATGAASERVRAGASLLSFLGRALITRDMYEGTAGTTGMSDVISKAITLLTETEHPAVGLARVQQFLSAVFQHDPTDYSATRFVLQELPPDRKHAEPVARHATASAAPKLPPKRSIGFWVLDNSTNLAELSRSSRSLLLTSGTLSPLDHFAAELGVEFPIRLCGQHVIDAARQVYGGVLCKGPGGEKLNGSYAFRQSVPYRLGLGMTLTNLSRVTPGGVLVFFPSYSALHSTVDLWKTAGTAADNHAGPPAPPPPAAASAASGTVTTSVSAAVRTVWGMLSEIKPVFVEPHDTGELNTVVQSFQKTVDDNPRRGAVLLAVCRGKVSEGVDFADHHGRSVVVTGIPFANQTDLFVRVKKAYLTEVAPSRPRVQGRLFTGDDWYRHEAMRAVNQCVGRVIRHKDDYGTVVLADERFSTHVRELSPWIAARTSVCTEFRECFAALNAFFAPFRRTMAGRRVREDEPFVDLATAAAARGGASASSTGLAPDTAVQAKQYAAAQAQQQRDEQAARVRRRLEDVTEAPVVGHMVPDSADVDSHSGTASGLIVDTAASPRSVLPALSSHAPSSLPALRLTRQTLVPVIVPAAAPAVSGAPSVALTSGVSIGPSSREFCQYLKQHVSVDSYERFKVLLRQIASYRTRWQDNAEASQRDFTLAVAALRVLFKEADPAHDLAVAHAFGVHIPPELQTLYKQLLR